MSHDQEKLIKLFTKGMISGLELILALEQRIIRLKTSTSTKTEAAALEALGVERGVREYLMDLARD